MVPGATLSSPPPDDVGGSIGKIKQGEAGTTVPQFAQTHLERTAGGATVYPVASEIKWTATRTAPGLG